MWICAASSLAGTLLGGELGERENGNTGNFCLDQENNTVASPGIHHNVTTKITHVT